MTIQYGGKPEELVFNFGTLRRLGELTKSDPFTLKIDADKPGDIYKYVYHIVLAALIGTNKTATEKGVRDTIDQWTLTEAIDVINAFKETFEVEPKQGEENGAQPAALMDRNS